MSIQSHAGEGDGRHPNEVVVRQGLPELEAAMRSTGYRYQNASANLAAVKAVCCVRPC